MPCLAPSSSPLLRVALETVLSDTPAPTPLPCDASVHHVTVPGLVISHFMDADQILPPPQYRDPFVHHLRNETARTCDKFADSSSSPTYRTSSPALLERLSTDQRSSFPQTCNRLPSHMHETAFYLDGPGSTMADITQLGEVLPEFSDVLSKFSADFGSCSLLPFEISVPPSSSPVAYRRYRINPPTVRQMDAVLNQFLAAGLVHSPHRHG